VPTLLVSRIQVSVSLKQREGALFLCQLYTGPVGSITQGAGDVYCGLTPLFRRIVKVKKGLFPWSASGRAIANTRDEGFTKLLFDEETHRIVGGGIVGTHAGDMIGEIALAIEMGADAVDIGKTIHPHPTLGESIGMAAEVAHGS